MLKKISAIVCSFTILMVCTAVSVFGYSVMIQEDYEGEKDAYLYYTPGATTARELVNGDGVNTSRFIQTVAGKSTDWGFYTMSSGVTGTVVIDFRAKTDGQNYLIFSTRQNSDYQKSTTVTIKNQGDGVWRYYRIVIEYDATPQTVSVYRSSTGWASLASVASGNVSSTISNATGFNQFKFQYCALDDIMIYQDGTAPVLTSPPTIALNDDENEFTASYTYYDNEGDEEANSAIIWQRADDATFSSYQDIPGATGAKYAITPADVGKYIRAAVTPKSTRVPETGTVYYSDAHLVTGLGYMYKELVSYDFDSHDNPFSSSSTQVLEGDGVNTTKHLYVTTTPGFTNIGELLTGTVIVDFRAKSFDQGSSGHYVTMEMRETNTLYNNTTAVGAVGLQSSTWRYYRYIINYDTHEITALTSTTGWSNMTEFSFPIARFAEGDNTPLGFSVYRFSPGYYDDISIYQYGTVPKLTENPVISKNNNMLSLSYTYYDKEGDPEGDTTVQWQVSDDALFTTYSVIADTGEKQYPLKLSDGGKYIRAVVSPVSQRYPDTGQQYTSNTLYIETIKITGVAFTDSVAGEIDDISDIKGTLTVTAGIDNEMTNTGRAVLLFALYGGDGSLLKVCLAESNSIPTGASNLSINDISFSGCDLTDAYAKVMVWDGFDTMYPYLMINFD